jgi:hypothetical protein
MSLHHPEKCDWHQREALRKAAIHDAAQIIKNLRAKAKAKSKRKGKPKAKSKRGKR